MKIYEINSKKYGKIEVLLDDEDYDSVKATGYSLAVTYDKTINNFYVGFTKKPNGCKSRLLHRFIMKPDDNMTVDHLNRNPLDNRRSNLRVCSQFINNQNQSHNSSGKVGVCYCKRDKVYKAYIRYKGKQIHLGDYKTFNKACDARLKAERKYFEEVN